MEFHSASAESLSNFKSAFLQPSSQELGCPGGTRLEMCSDTEKLNCVSGIFPGSVLTSLLHPFSSFFPFKER